MLERPIPIRGYEKFKSSDNLWRFEGIRIEHSHGYPPLRDKGWNTYRDKATNEEIKVPETIDSSKTPFDALILLVPPQVLGTHEATDPEHPDDPKYGDRGWKINGFEPINNFENGWEGSAIAVAAFCVCRGKEVISNKIYKKVYQTLVENGGRAVLDDLKYGDLGILDGHHRNAKAIKNGLKFVPVQLIPYLFDKSVVLDTWHNDGIVWTPEQVFACFKIPDKYADAKRTKFGVIGTDGVTRRILDTQPDVYITLQNLV